MLLQISYIGFISAIFLKNSEKYSIFVVDVVCSRILYCKIAIFSECISLLFRLNAVSV